VQAQIRTALRAVTGLSLLYQTAEWGHIHPIKPTRSQNDFAHCHAFHHLTKTAKGNGDQGVVRIASKSPLQTLIDSHQVFDLRDARCRPGGALSKVAFVVAVYSTAKRDLATVSNDSNVVSVDLRIAD
jgi:hypothetical protein